MFRNVTLPDIVLVIKWGARESSLSVKISLLGEWWQQKRFQYCWKRKQEASYYMYVYSVRSNHNFSLFDGSGAGEEKLHWTHGLYENVTARWRWTFIIILKRESCTGKCSPPLNYIAINVPWAAGNVKTLLISLASHYNSFFPVGANQSRDNED